MMDRQSMPPQTPMVDPVTGIPYSNSSVTGLIENQDSKFLEWLINPDNIIRQLENNLRGVRFKINQETGEEEPEPTAYPLMNDEGVRAIIRVVRIYVGNPAFASTHFKEENVEEMTLVFGEELMGQIIMMYDAHWNLKYENIGLLKSWITDIVYASLMRSKNGNLLKAITQTYSERYLSGTPQQQQPSQGRRKGMIGKLFGI